MEMHVTRDKHITCQVEVESFLGNLGLSPGNGQHDPEPHRDDQSNDDPRGGHVTENPAVPQRQKRADQQNEIPDQIHVDETHGDPHKWKRRKTDGGRKQKRRPSAFSLPPSVFARLDYRVTRTTIAARRLSRRVSSRALSYFGRSSP